jgi:excisionase family DNA binding protein
VNAKVEREREERAKEWATPREVAKELGVSVRSIYDLIHNGRIRAKEKESLTGRRRYWLIPVTEIERLRRLREG